VNGARLVLTPESVSGSTQDDISFEMEAIVASGRILPDLTPPPPPGLAR
jgi:hypothetical protein